MMRPVLNIFYFLRIFLLLLLDERQIRRDEVPAAPDHSGGDEEAHRGHPEYGSVAEVHRHRAGSDGAGHIAHDGEARRESHHHIPVFLAHRGSEDRIRDGHDESQRQAGQAAHDAQGEYGGHKVLEDEIQARHDGGGDEDAGHVEMRREPGHGERRHDARRAGGKMMMPTMVATICASPPIMRCT